jgi:Protein of unknown function (DUF3592)
LSNAIPRPLILIFEVIGGLALLAAVGWYVGGWLDYRSARDWPLRDAMVVSATVDVSYSSDTNTKNSMAGEAPSYIPVVRYRYTADGKERQSEDTFLNGAPVFNTMEEAQGELVDYPVGSRIKAVVNPDDPDQAVLVVNQPDLVGYLILAIFGALFCGVGALLSRFSREDATPDRE